jgi:hypothetical protein
MPPLKKKGSPSKTNKTLPKRQCLGKTGLGIGKKNISRGKLSRSNSEDVSLAGSRSPSPVKKRSNSTSSVVSQSSSSSSSSNGSKSSSGKKKTINKNTKLLTFWNKPATLKKSKNFTQLFLNPVTPQKGKRIPNKPCRAILSYCNKKFPDQSENKNYNVELVWKKIGK